MIWRFVTYKVVLAAAAVSAAVTAAPVEAIIIPSYGFWWHYDNPTSFSYQAWLPGVKLSGTGTDNGNIRSTTATLADTRPDSRCAVALGGGDNEEDQFWTKTCDNQPPTAVAIRAFTGLFWVKFCSEPASPPPYGVCVVIKVPSSVGDDALRTAGSGASWTYAPSVSWYTFSLTRPGVHVFGDAYSPAQPTTVSATVQNTSGGGYTCATGSATQLDEELNATTCAAGQQTAFTGSLTYGGMTVHACTDVLLSPPRCVEIRIPAELHAF
jgi:hypothetical protein